MTFPSGPSNGAVHRGDVTAESSPRFDPAVHASLSPPPPPSFGRVLWDAWKAYSHRAGSYQAGVLLSIVYFLVLGPSILLARLTGTRLLDLDRRPRPTYWIERLQPEKTLAALERQF